MNRLLGSSPIRDHSAISNSSLALDLNVLKQSRGGSGLDGNDSDDSFDLNLIHLALQGTEAVELAEADSLSAEFKSKQNFQFGYDEHPP